MILLLH